MVDDRNVRGLSPHLAAWSKLPDINGAKQEELYQRWLESLLYANYLMDIISDRKDPSEQLQQHKRGIRELAKSVQLNGQDIANRYQAVIHKVTEVCKCLPTSTGWAKTYENFLWLISRALGTPYALLVGCAVKQREFRLRYADQARLFSFLVVEQQSLSCDVLAEDKYMLAPLELVPAKRNQHGQTIPSTRAVNQRNGKPEHCDQQSARESHRDEDWAPVDFAWQQLSNPARRFLKFLGSLRIESIPEVLLLRLMIPTEIWSPSGEIENVRTPPIDPVVEDLIHGTAFDFIQIYIRMGLVRETPGDFGRRGFTVSPKIRTTLVEAEPFIPDMEWRRLTLVCHAFPGRWEEQWFVDTGRVLFPQIRYSFQNCDRLKEKCIENPTYGYKVLLTLILSTKLPGPDWKVEAMNNALNILSCNPKFPRQSDASYLNGLVKLRMAEVSRRLQGVHFGDLSGIDPPTDPRSNSLEGAWRQFEAQERIMMTQPDMHGAATVLKDFTFWDAMAPSTSERHVLNQHKLCQGKIQRWCAEFELASATFNGLEDDIGAYYDDTGCSFWNHYIATLCELHKFKNAEHWARHVVRGYERLYEQGVYLERQKRQRTLRLSLAEVLACKCLVERATAPSWTADVCTALEEAEDIYKGLDHEYAALAKRDWATQFEHLRVHIGRALMAYLVGDRFEESQKLWQDALELARYCEDHDKITGFVQMVINYSLCDIASRLGDMNRAHTHLRIAKTLFSELGREHWWTCMGTAMLDLLAKSLDKANLVSGITSSIL